MINPLAGAPDAEDVEIGNRIASAMLIKGVSAAKLSDETGISYPTLRRSLKGTRSFSFSEFGKIARVLGVTKTALLTDELAGREVTAGDHDNHRSLASV